MSYHMTHGTTTQTCPVCGGTGFVRAAPLSVTNPYGLNGVAAIGRNNHRRALWSSAVMVPCWACAGMPIIESPGGMT